MKRRNFLAFLGAAVAAPKILAKEVAKERPVPEVVGYPWQDEGFMVGDLVRHRNGHRAIVTDINSLNHPRICTLMPYLPSVDLGNGAGFSINILDGSADWVCLRRQSWI